MWGKQTHFFATGQDLDELLRAIEERRPLRFVRAGLLDTPEVESTTSLRRPGLGAATTGDAVQLPCYLVMDPNSPPQVMPVPQRRGGTKYAIDQSQNPESIALRPGGVFDEIAVISGEVSTISEASVSLELHGLFKREIRRRFTRIASFHVGKGASELLDRGWRLTASVRSPTLYDLQRE